jgi:putative pyruvate formate lyase activating enzyme
MSVDEIAREIIRLLPDCENRVGFVSASQFVPHVVAIVETVHSLGVHPVFVYNSNGYDHPEMLRLLEGKIDVYLPDFKYSDSLLAKRLSGVDDYPQVAIRAIREMYRQKGSPLWLDDNGLAESGLIIRHLLLPGMVQQSIEALRMVAEEISASVHISLMSQYYPPVEIPAFPELNRMLREEEYLTVTNAFCQLGFHKGWMQELGSDEHFRPHFDKDNPFPNL